MEKKFFTVPEAAEYLNYSPRTIYRLIEEGQVIAFNKKRGGSLRITKKSIDAYVDRLILRYKLEHSIFVTGDDIE